MKVKTLNISGIDIVLDYVGMPLKYQPESREEAIKKLSIVTCAGDNHAKLCRMIVAWFEINAPRYWWQEMATYRIGTEMYSESTMYTITRRPLTQNDFEGETIDKHTLNIINKAIDNEDLLEVKKNLPESFLQRRLMMISYQTLRRIWLQRCNHMLKEWHMFLDTVEKLPLAHDLIFTTRI